MMCLVMYVEALKILAYGSLLFQGRLTVLHVVRTLYFGESVDTILLDT